MLSQDSQKPWDYADSCVVATGRTIQLERVEHGELVQPRAVWAGLPTRAAASSLVLLIRLYQWLLSPVLGPTCRFHPTCSAYAIEAIRLHGPVFGSGRAIARLARCHPWSDGGYDPVQ